MRHIPYHERVALAHGVLRPAREQKDGVSVAVCTDGPRPMVTTVSCRLRRPSLMRRALHRSAARPPRCRVRRHPTRHQIARLCRSNMHLCRMRSRPDRDQDESKAHRPRPRPRHRPRHRPRPRPRPTLGLALRPGRGCLGGPSSLRRSVPSFGSWAMWPSIQGCSTRPNWPARRSA